jgi:DNA-binding transcriptional MerR regulator
MLLLQGTMATTYSISELAREFDVTTRTIRFYEDQGLLSPTREGTTRLFSPRDRVRLKLALRGKRLGFSLAEIRELFELYDVSRDEHKQLEEFLVKLERRRAGLEQQREDIEVMLNEIDFFANQCRRLLRGERKAASVRPASGPLDSAVSG